jgi:hypothetical protein
VDQVDHDRVHGSYGDRREGGSPSARRRWLSFAAGVVGVLAGVVLRNRVHCVGGVTAMAIEHAASSRMSAGWHRPEPSRRVLSRMLSPPFPRSLWWHCRLRGLHSWDDRRVAPGMRRSGAFWDDTCAAMPLMTPATIEAVAVIVRRIDQRRAQR